MAATPDGTNAGSGYPDATTGWSDLRSRVAPVPHDLVIEIAARLAHRVPGNIIEFGVFEGYATRVLRRTVDRLERGQLVGPKKLIFGCDSFRGMPEQFENLGVGDLACTPPSIPRVQLVEGYFANTLTPALARRVGAVALASFDADLYSSTLVALQWLTPLLHTGSLLLFDEYLGQDAAESRAHARWIEECGLRTVRLAEFLRDTSGQGGDRGYGSEPDRRVLFQVVDAGPMARTRVFGPTQARILAGRLRARLTPRRASDQ